jgi:hypothetical protein
MERQIPVGYAAALLASFLFGWAITPSRGAYSDPAMTMVVLGTIVVGWRSIVDFRKRLDLVPARVLAPLAWGCCLAMAFTAYNDAEIIIYPVKFWEAGRKAQGWLLVALIAYLPSMLKWKEPRWARHLRFGVVALCIFVAGRDTYATSPTPYIDVWTVQQQGATALLDGKNPYQEVHVGDTGPRSASDVPYVYPPMQLYVTAPALKLFGDTRFTILGAALLLGFALRALATRFGGKELPAIIEDAPALFIWCTPKFFFILEQAWVDPVQICWCSLLILSAAWRKPWLTAVLAGLVVGAKQTMLLFAGLVGFGLRFGWRQWAVAGGVALSTFLPWMIWDFKAWKHANFDFLSALPVRPDALTYITWVRRKFNVEIPYVVAFPFAFALASVSAWKSKRTLGGVTMAAVATMTVFFVFNKWAFANYYFTLLGLSALSAAASLGDDQGEPPPLTPAAPAMAPTPAPAKAPTAA